MRYRNKKSHVLKNMSISYLCNAITEERLNHLDESKKLFTKALRYENLSIWWLAQGN